VVRRLLRGGRVQDILSRRTTKRSIANKAGNSFSVATFNSNSTVAAIKPGSDKARPPPLSSRLSVLVPPHADTIA